MRPVLQCSRWTVVCVVVALAGGAEGLPGASQSGQRPSPYRRDPFADAAAATRRFETAVKLVKLDSCEPAILAKPQLAPMDSKDAAARSRAQADMDRYHDVLAAYAEGDLAGAIGQLAAFDRERLSRTLGSVNRRGVDRHAPWDGRRYALAVMLHTDAGLQFAGETYGGEMYDCLQAAADLLQLGAQCAPDTIRPLAPRWYVGLSRLFRDRAVLHAAEALLGLGRVRLADEASVLFESGLLAESLATIYALAPTRTAAAWTSGDALLVRQTVDRRRAWLQNAADWLGRAAALEPGNDELLLHLGRTHALRSEDDKALSALRSVLARTPSAEIAYLAAVFSGAIHDRRGNLDEAADAYREAVKKLPGGHAGQIGLAEALRRAGRLDEARERVRAYAAWPPGRTQEPFWWYVLELPGAADARMDALRAEVRR